MRFFHVEEWKVGTSARQQGVHKGTIDRALSQAGLAKVERPRCARARPGRCPPPRHSHASTRPHSQSPRSVGGRCMPPEPGKYSRCSRAQDGRGLVAGLVVGITPALLALPLPLACAQAGALGAVALGRVQDGFWGRGTNSSPLQRLRGAWVIFSNPSQAAS